MAGGVSLGAGLQAAGEQVTCRGPKQAKVCPVGCMAGKRQPHLQREKAAGQGGARRRPRRQPHHPALQRVGGRAAHAAAVFPARRRVQVNRPRVGACGNMWLMLPAVIFFVFVSTPVRDCCHGAGAGCHSPCRQGRRGCGELSSMSDAGAACEARTQKALLQKSPRRARAHDGGDCAAPALPALRAGPSLLLEQALCPIQLVQAGPAVAKQQRAACRRAPATEQRGLRAFHVIM